MTVLCPPSSNRVPALLGALVLLGGVLAVFVVWFWFSPRHTDVGYQPIQPVPYSHKLHAGLMGMDCRYCHQNVEDGPHATIPDANTCMNCHTRVLPESEFLKPVRDAHKDTNAPVRWLKVHLLPDFAYFNHAAHVSAGVGCASCHGRIDQMEIVRQAEPLSMSWCLECHRAPAQHLRPADKITDMAFVPNPEEGRRIMAEKKLNPPIHCSGCHR